MILMAWKKPVSAWRTVQSLCVVLAAALAGAARGQVNLPEGFEIVRFGYTENLSGLPQTNNCGQIVYQEQMGASTADWEIMWYDNGNLRQLTDNDDWDALPRINDHGTMLLLRGHGDQDTSKLLILEDGRDTLFDENPLSFGGTSLNNKGHIAWSRMTSLDCPEASTSYLWNGRKTIQISPDELFDQGESLNELDQVAYMHTDFCVNPWAGDIRLFLSPRRTIIMPSRESQVQAPTLNNLGQVAWSAPTGVEFWDGRQVTLLAEDGNLPVLNNLGDMYFSRWDWDRSRWQPWLYRVSGGSPTFHRLADDDAYHSRGDINDWGEVAWIWREHLIPTPHEMWYLRRMRTGDSQFDGDVDADDYGVFASCMTGPNWDELYQRGPQDSLCDCRFLDLDYDGDVDLGDFARFQNVYRTAP